MATEARISKTYAWRPLVFALMFLGFSAWSAYDGFVNYPQMNQIYADFQSYQKQHPDDWKETWRDYAAQKGYSSEQPTYKGEWSMRSQYIMLGLCLPLGLGALWVYLRNFSRWIRMDENGLTANSGQTIAFAAITELNKERWRSKGIAVVRYKDPQGQARRLILDDWKYEQEPITLMVKEVQARLKSEQIVGDIQPPSADIVSTDFTPPTG